MTLLWLIGWALAGLAAGLAVAAVVILWWQPPELLALAWGGASVCAGWVAGAWWEDRRS